MAKRRISKLSLTVLAGLVLCGCVKPRAAKPDVLRAQLGSEPETLNPILATDAYAGEINQYVFDTLIDMDPDTLEYIPKLAERWEISPDRKTYTFHLRKDVRWHDGEPFTADDVIYSYNLVRDPKVNAPVLRVYIQDIEAAEKIDDHTVRFRYAKVYFKGLSVCGATIPVVPKHVLEKEKDLEHSPFSRAPLGNGPYRFKKWETNKRIVLTRNDAYWGKKPEIREIEFTVIHDTSVGLQMLKKGLLDVFQLRNIQWVRQTGSEKFKAQFEKLSYPGQSYSYIGWNMKSPYFDDRRVRRAMTLMVDRQKLKDTVLFGLANLVTGPFFPYSPQNNPAVKPPPYDPAGAKKLLDEAGWRDTDGDGLLDQNGTPFKFLFLYPAGSKFSERLATIMKEDLERVGIEMEIARLEWAAFLEKIRKREFDATNLAWSTPFESDPYQLWHSSQAGIPDSSNYVSFADKEADRYIEGARVEFDEDKRNALYWRFQEIIDREQPYTFLYAQPNLLAVSKRFDNVIVHKAGINILEWKVRK